MKEEKYLLDRVNPLYQMHDERISDILVKDDMVIFNFNELIHLEANKKNCKLIFLGFNDIYTDIKVFVFNTDSDLNISGKLFYFDDFINNFIFKGKPIMDVTDIFCGYNTIIIRGILLKKSGYSQRNISIQIDAKELSYRWL